MMMLSSSWGAGGDTTDIIASKKVRQNTQNWTNMVELTWVGRYQLERSWEGGSDHTRDSIFLPEGMWSLTLLSDPRTAGVIVRGT